MALVRNARSLFHSAPNTYPEPGKATRYDDSQTIDLDTPYTRGRMSEPSVKGYMHIASAPLRSVKAGDHVYGMVPFQEYTVVAEPAQLGPTVFRVLDNKEGLPWSVYVRVCGMTGEYSAFASQNHSLHSPGETTFVTAAAGSVGATVVLIAKAAGLKVIASAGSDAKLAFVRSLGADVVFNYKTEDTRAVLEREGGIDIFWDNVGGETFEAALDAAHQQARFIVTLGVKNLMQIVGKELRVSGFIVDSLYHKYREPFLKEFPAAVAAGTIKYSEDVSRGLESVGEAIVAVQKGTNNGKKIVVVADA
ncbi:NAD-P-binding protein [Fomitopsis betulina]|nr:NAD-P-binding protein [Fomitopsis betulina]